MRTVIDNFLSQPGRFKFNRDQTKAYIIRQIKTADTTSQSASTYTFEFEVYRLPDFEFLGSTTVSWLTQSSSFIYLDVSEDEKFAIIGDDQGFVLCTLNFLVPQIFSSDDQDRSMQSMMTITLPNFFKDYALPNQTKSQMTQSIAMQFQSEAFGQHMTSIGVNGKFDGTQLAVRFNENNEIVFFSVKEKIVSVLQTKLGIKEILMGMTSNDSFISQQTSMSDNSNQLFKKGYYMDLKQYQIQNQGVFQVFIFGGNTFYLRFGDQLFSCRSDFSSNPQANQSLVYWDPIKGSYQSVTREAPRTGNGPQQNLQQPAQIQVLPNNEAFQGIIQAFVQEDVLVVQGTNNVVTLYKQQSGQVKGSIVQVKQLKINLNNEEMIAFKLYQSNLYLKNDSVTKLEVFNFADPTKLKRLWTYQYDQNLIIEAVHQLSFTHYINLLEKESQTQLRQMNGYKNELLFKQMWPNQKAKFSLVAHGQLFQDGENDGSVLIVDQKGQSRYKVIKEQKGMNQTSKFTNKIKNIYYSEELQMLVLVRYFSMGNKITTQIFLMNPQGPNFEVLTLSKEFQDQDITLLGTLYKENNDKNVVVLLGLMENQNLVQFEIKVDLKPQPNNPLYQPYSIIKKNPTGLQQQTGIISSGASNGDLEYVTLFEQDNLTPGDVYIQKESKIMLLKLPFTDTQSKKLSPNDLMTSTRMKTDQYDYSMLKLQNAPLEKALKASDLTARISQKGRLIKVFQNKLFFLNQSDKSLQVYEAFPSQNKIEELKGASKVPQIKASDFKILWDSSDKPKQISREQEDKNERFIVTEHFFVCQNLDKYYILDAKTFDLKCQINNAPTESTFVRSEDKQFYLLVKSALDGFIDVKKFNLLEDKPLLSLNKKEELSTYYENQKENKGKEVDVDPELRIILDSERSQPQNDLPEEFDLSKDTFLLYDYVDPRVELYDSAEAGNLKMWTNLCSRSILQKQIFGNNNKKIIMDYFLKKPTSPDQVNNFLECLFYDTLHYKTVLHYVIDNSLVFSAIIEKLLTMKEEELPYLMFADARGETPLDIAIKNQQNKNVVSLLKLMVYHKSAADQYNPHIDKHLINLIRMGLNLKDLFDSEILYHPIAQYPPQEKQSDNYLYSCVYEFQDDIYNNYDIIVNEKNGFVNLQNAAPEEADDAGEIGEDGMPKEKQFSVDYFLIDMKHTLSFMGENGKPTLMEALEATDRQDIFEFPCIQNVIDYKWKTFTKTYFLKQFYLFMTLCILFFISLFVQQKLIEEDLTRNTLAVIDLASEDMEFGTYMLANIVLTGACGVIASYFLIRELKQFLTSNFAEYLTDLYNLNDLLLFSLLPLQGILHILQLVDITSDWIKLIKCLIVLMFFVKLLFFLRIFDTFSFLVSMLSDVFVDLSAFMAFFMMAVVIFSCLLQILLPETKVNYEGTGPFSYIMMAFRTSIGDFTFDNYKATVMKEVTWIVWLALTIIGNVVFMNFIIAVVNDSYAQSMAKQVSQQYRLKVPMINECEKFIKNTYDQWGLSDKLKYKADIERKRQELDEEKKRIEEKAALYGYKQGAFKNDAESKQTQITIVVPNFIVVREVQGTGGNDPAADQQKYFNDLQAQIQEIQRTQNEQSDEFQALKTSVDTIRDLLIEARAIRNPALASNANADDGVSMAGGAPDQVMPKRGGVQQQQFQQRRQ